MSMHHQDLKDAEAVQKAIAERRCVQILGTVPGAKWRGLTTVETPTWRDLFDRGVKFRVLIPAHAPGDAERHASLLLQMRNRYEETDSRYIALDAAIAALSASPAAVEAVYVEPMVMAQLRANGDFVSGAELFTAPCGRATIALYTHPPVAHAPDAVPFVAPPKVMEQNADGTRYLVVDGGYELLVFTQEEAAAWNRCVDEAMRLNALPTVADVPLTPLQLAKWLRVHFRGMWDHPETRIPEIHWIYDTLANLRAAPSAAHAPGVGDGKAAGGNAEYVLALLIGAGFVTQTKVDEARKIALGFADPPLTPNQEQVGGDAVRGLVVTDETVRIALSAYYDMAPGIVCKYTTPGQHEGMKRALTATLAAATPDKGEPTKEET